MSYSSFIQPDCRQHILVFGRDGQVGRALQIYLQDLKVPAVFLGRADCDLTNELAIIEVLNHYQPHVIINAAAYTDVDKAETERDLAYAINAKAPELMARYIVNTPNGVLVHYSTDYVFADGKDEAYDEADPVGFPVPLNFYGQSKLAGEKAIEEVFNSAYNSGLEKYANEFARYFIFRTSWVYGDGDNFIRTILRLAGERYQLKVVSNQVGAPTSAQWLAEVAIQIASSRAESGIYHAVPDGETSWYGLAVFVIGVVAGFSGLAELRSVNILPTTITDYLAPARRPCNSRLNNAKLKKVLLETALWSEYPQWQEQVEFYVKKYVLSSLKTC